MRRTGFVLTLLAFPGVLLAQAPAATAPTVAVGLASDKNEIVDPQTSFTLEGDTKIYVGAKATAGAGDYTISYRKSGAVVLAKRIPVPSTPFRIWTWKTFRKGDAGDWTAVVTGPGGAEASTAFTVAFK